MLPKNERMLRIEADILLQADIRAIVTSHKRRLFFSWRGGRGWGGLVSPRMGVVVEIRFLFLLLLLVFVLACCRFGSNGGMHHREHPLGKVMQGDFLHRHPFTAANLFRCMTILIFSIISIMEGVLLRGGALGSKGRIGQRVGGPGSGGGAIHGGRRRGRGGKVSCRP